MTTNTPAPTMFAATFDLATMEALTDQLLHAAAMNGRGITANLLADAFAEALDGERDTVILGAVEMAALTDAIADAKFATNGRQALLDARDAFAPLEVNP